MDGLAAEKDHQQLNRQRQNPPQQPRSVILMPLNLKSDRTQKFRRYYFHEFVPTQLTFFTDISFLSKALVFEKFFPILPIFRFTEIFIFDQYLDF